MNLQRTIRNCLWIFTAKIRSKTIPQDKRERIINDFLELYYDQGSVGSTWTNTSWLGVPIGKCPFDTWIYQELLFKVKPDLIIETGTYVGGSAYYLACICDLIGSGRVISIDVTKKNFPKHSRIEYITDSSTSSKTFDYIQSEAQKSESVMVILDSDHSKEHVSRELELYHRLVTAGSYLIVEDTSVNGHPIFPEHGPGPMEALNDFLARNNEFEADPIGAKFLMSFNPKGYLRKVK